jgi:hypothetical protein
MDRINLQQQNILPGITGCDNIDVPLPFAAIYEGTGVPAIVEVPKGEI